MIASMFLGDVGVIGCTSKVIAPIKQLWLCVSVLDSLISLILHDEILMITCKCFTQHAILCYYWYNCTDAMWIGHHKEYMC